MAASKPRISLLPDDVWKKVASSCEITSPQHVIEGLLRNALDADASSIVIEVEFSKGYVSICDNGNGIKQVEFSEQGQLARLHCTKQLDVHVGQKFDCGLLGSSKLSSSDPTYGRYGRFLSNLSHLSLLSISSKHQSEEFANRLILHRGNIVCRQLRLDKEDVGIVRKGTTVTVHNLFGDIPVRFKHLSHLHSSSTETERAFNQVKAMFVGYLLAQPHAVEVRFSLKGEKQPHLHCRSPLLSQGRFSLESIVSTLFQAKLVTSLDTTNWRAASVRTSQFCIRAAISVELSPNKTNQFISIAKSPIRRGQSISCLYDVIDRLYEVSSFRSPDSAPSAPCGVTKHRKPQHNFIQPVRLQKAVDKWPMFHIQIEPRSCELSRILGSEHSGADALPIVDHLTKAVETLFSNFLFANGYSADSGRNESKSVRDRRKREDPSRRRPIEQSSAKVSKSATEARYLNNWQRVKSARLSREDFRYGLNLRNPDGISCLPTRATEGRPFLGSLRSGEPGYGNAACETQTVCNDNDETVVGLPLFDSHNGQVVYLHPRTGAVIPRANPNPACSDRSRGCCSPLAQRQRLPASNNSEGQKPPTKPVLNLQQYLRTKSHHQADAPIACRKFEPVSDVFGKCYGADGQGKAVVESQIVTKGALSSATVIQQVDRKFILTTLALQDPRDPCSAERHERRLLGLIDQHAADERVKFEKLCSDICKRTSTNLTTPMIFEVDEIEARLLEEHREYFSKWCIGYCIVEEIQAAQSSRSHHTWTVRVTMLPTLIIERCRADPKLLADIIRGEIWLGGALRRRTPLPHPPQPDEPSWWSDMADCPKGIIEMLKSRSCRTAVMFNDHLDTRQCHQLVQSLSQCTFPFQCAHGRPTLTVLAELAGGDFGGPGMGAYADPSAAALAFGDAWRGWQSRRIG
ncbi:hypothetical protein AYL99_04729 [Fonsecaea erecta]|uniref:MutL C-terminal dimerisation domain-containing protein n=1 Tax=Fonsecaea erecta TaxID=1367422 RepID=A0A178ZRS8_9EURO|nr:hypothetical protein AYL99_04729 [Fonsecaea erecta]OAP62524.1 hypothetical protein AYL99_04729 [Fonsecaea erecta]